MPRLPVADDVPARGQLRLVTDRSVTVRDGDDLDNSSVLGKIEDAQALGVLRYHDARTQHPPKGEEDEVVGVRRLLISVPVDALAHPSEAARAAAARGDACAITGWISDRGRLAEDAYKIATLLPPTPPQDDGAAPVAEPAAPPLAEPRAPDAPAAAAATPVAPAPPVAATHCPICGQDFSSLSPRRLEAHVNACAEQQQRVSTLRFASQESAETACRYHGQCPICAHRFGRTDSAEARTAHVNSCLSCMEPN